MRYVKIIIGIVGAGILSWIIMVYLSQEDIRTIRLERIVDPLPEESLYYPSETWHPPYPEDDSCTCITLIFDC